MAAENGDLFPFIMGVVVAAFLSGDIIEWHVLITPPFVALRRK